MKYIKLFVFVLIFIVLAGCEAIEIEYRNKNENIAPLISTTAENSEDKNNGMEKTKEPSIKTEKISKTDNDFKYEISYPLTKNIHFNSQIEKFINETIAQMGKYADETSYNINENLKSTLSVNFSEHRFKERIIGITFTIDTYLKGAAHPNIEFKTFAFNFESERILKLEDLVKGDFDEFLNIVSKNVINDIRNKLEKDRGEIMEEGATANMANFENFYLEEKGITFLFAPYEVAAYAHGPQESTVSWDQIKEIVKEEYL